MIESLKASYRQTKGTEVKKKKNVQTCVCFLIYIYIYIYIFFFDEISDRMNYWVLHVKVECFYEIKS